MLTLYYFAIVILIHVAEGEAKCEDPSFKCDPNNPYNVIFNGMVLKCPNKTSCNTKLETCDLCVSGTCGGRFECHPSSPNLVTIDGYTLDCPQDTVCNNGNLNNDCKPCVREKCNGNSTSQFSCSENDPSAVVVQGIVFKCKKNYKCNKLHEKPCTACIEDLDYKDGGNSNVARPAIDDWDYTI